MTKQIVTFLFLGVVLTSLFSCSSANLGVSRANVYYEFGRNDMDVSEQKSAEATQTKILGIDFARLFNKETGSISANGYAVSVSAVPFIGSYLDPTKVQNYALFNLLKKEPTYDFVLYPRFEQESFKVLFFYSKTKTKVTARLGKIK